MYVCMYIHIYVYVCMYVCVYVCMYVCMYIYMALRERRFQSIPQFHWIVIIFLKNKKKQQCNLTRYAPLYIVGQTHI